MRKISLLLCSVLMCSLLFTGCGNKNTDAGTLTVMLNGTRPVEELTAAKNLEAKYDGKIKWLTVADSEQQQLFFASGDYGDVVLGNILTDTLISQYAANGIVIPLDEYINEDVMPNLTKLFEQHPTLKAVSTLTDGHIYSLPRYNGLSADYLESVMFINKTWLDKLGLEVPTTIEELYDVLKAFKEGDPNGNGLDDEIPISFLTDHSFAFPEAMLSSWGRSTKHGSFEGFLTIKDGEVEFAPITDAWKEMILYYNRLYADGLLDKEAFTQTNEQFWAKLGAAESIVGVSWSKTNPFANADEYIAMAPVSAPGYDIAWRIHPGSLGIKNQFSVTNKCKDIEGVMRWVDTFYTEEATLENWYGPVGETFTVEDGMYKFNEPEAGKTISTMISENTLLSYNMPGVFHAEEIGTLVEEYSVWTEQMDAYELYKPYLDKEPWPRPYYTDSDTKRISELRTDILNIVAKTKASWVVGNSNINDEWDDYVKNLYQVGLQEYIDINQKAYDVYQEAMNK